MRILTADTKIRVKRNRPALTGDTKIRLSQIKDLLTWQQVKDRRYRPGEISEKTGLQKQPDGSWKQPEHSNTNYKSQSTTEEKPERAEHTEAQKKQTKETEKRINKTGWFKNSSNLDGMHPEAAANIETQCARIFQEYPALTGFIEGLKVEDFTEEESKAFAKCEGTGESAYIIFNKKYFSNNKALQETYQKSVDEGYHPAGTTADSLVVHEISHCICDYLAQKRGQDFDEFNREVVEFAKNQFEEAGYNFDIINGLAGYCTDPKACPTKEIQNAEIIAEAYTEYKCSESPRLIALFIGRLLEGELE